MTHSRLIRSKQALMIPILSLGLMSCVGLPPGSGSTPVVPEPISQTQNNQLTGVLMWKGNPAGTGLYTETILNSTIVNPNTFGEWGTFSADGIIMAQPLFVNSLDMGALGTHNVIITVTENDSVYAIDGDNPDNGSLWERHYLDPAAGIVALPDTFKGRTTLGPEAGITGTPVIDSSTGIMYFVTALVNNGTPQQWLRSIDIRSGQDAGAGSMLIQASVPGNGDGNVNGQIAFDPSIHNQRTGLTMVNGSVIVAWGSFSDHGGYHGWLMAFDPKTLALQAVFNPTTEYQATDWVNGAASHGGGGGFWQGGASPAVDSSGYIYVDAANGSFNADLGGNNYGNTMIKLALVNGSFQIVDWFTPYDDACTDIDDLELGSGGISILPSDSFTNGANLAISLSKEGRLFLVDTDNLGKFNPQGDTQIKQEIIVGLQTCGPTTTPEAADGTGWNRLYGNASYWNGNVYAGAANLPLRQYQFQNGSLSPSPIATSPTFYGTRGGNSVVSANGNQGAIVWVYEKSASGSGILHAYDANYVSSELWNSNMYSGRDSLGEGINFMTPVVVNGRVIVAYDNVVVVYGQLQP